MKVLFLANIPSPYRVKFFNELGKYCDLTVSFEGLTASNRNVKWKGEEPQNFKPVYLRGIRYNVESFLCVDILKLIRQHWDFIIIGVYSSATSILAIEYMRIHRIKFIISADGGLIGEENPIKYRIKKHFISSASYWLSTGKTTTDYLVHYGASRCNTFVFPFTSLSQMDISNALEKLEYSKNKLREQLKIKESYMVLSVGQFIYRKGFDLLIQCASSLPDNVGIYIIGGEATEDYIKMKNRYKVKNVHFLNFMEKDDLAQYYAASDLFVFPTREDIWGLVINEAMAFGLPVITTNRCVAGLELIKDGENGYIIPVNSVNVLTEKIMCLINNEQLRTKFRKENLKRIRKYTIENMAKVHINILNQIYRE